MKQNVILGTIVVAIIGGAIFLISTSSKPNELQTERTTREVALTCDPEMAQGFHIHPILKIVADGEPIEVPANIGVRSNCMTVLHTHTPDGVIHVESPERRDFTLGDFFAVWEQPFNKDEVLSYKADTTHEVRVTVNGVEVGTYENTVLRDADQIEISFGSF
jgi:hypothetical protein